MENAFGHPGKYENHWVHPVFLVALQEPNHVHAERQERAVEEAVHHEHLTCYQNKSITTKLILIFFISDDPRICILPTYL